MSRKIKITVYCCGACREVHLMVQENAKILVDMPVPAEAWTNLMRDVAILQRETDEQRTN